MKIGHHSGLAQPTPDRNQPPSRCGASTVMRITFATVIRRTLLAVLSLLLAAVFCFSTGLVPGWGRWYSNNFAYREQTEAMLHGSLALASTPTAEAWDMAWAKGGVQQVWGLGVPCWRLPFEAFAKMCGCDAFPDRVAFGLALALIVFAVVRIRTPFCGIGSSSARSCLPETVAGVFLLVFFPPFVTLCRTWFNVYEEAEAYTYLTGIGLFLGTIWFLRFGEMRHYLVLSLGAGLVAFVRPTLGVYGLVSLSLAWAKTRRMRWPLPKSLAGLGLFLSGGGLLFATNQLRFGSGFEFGHSLNLNGYDVMQFTTHIQNPLHQESFPALFKELFSFLFFTRGAPLSNQGFNAGLFPGQLTALRWRDLYYSSYDWTFLIVCVGVSCWMVWAFWERKRNRTAHRDNGLGAAGAWSILSAIPLFLFYLHYPVLSPRYMLDFGPAIAAAMWTFACGSRLYLPNNWRSGLIVCTLVTLWWSYEVVSARILPVTRHPGSISFRQMSSDMMPKLIIEKPLPDSYAVGTDLGDYGIPFNGAGWNSTNGATKCMATFFIQDPQFLEMDIAPARGVHADESDWSQIRAKIGLQFLTLESMRATKEGETMLFQPPHGQNYRSGIQVAFIGFTGPQDLSTNDSKFRLLRISWNAGAP